MAEADLEQFGIAADASLVLVTRKLVCSRCRSKAVRAYRYIDDALQPVFQGPPVAPEDQAPCYAPAVTPHCIAPTPIRLIIAARDESIGGRRQIVNQRGVAPNRSSFHAT